MYRSICRQFVLIAAFLVVLSSVAEATGYLNGARRMRHMRLLHITTSTATLSDIVNYIGDRYIHATPLVHGDQDYRKPSVTKSTFRAIEEAQVFVRLGADFDPWVDDLIAQTTNTSVGKGSATHVDVSAAVKSSGGSASGYFWLDPVNAKAIAGGVLDAMTKAAPVHAEYFKANHKKFCQKRDEQMAVWQARLNGAKATTIVTDNNWSALIQRFGLNQALISELETADNAGLIELVQKTKALDGHKLLILDSIRDKHLVESLSQSTQARIAIIPSSVKAREQIRDYFELIDEIVGILQRSSKAGAESSL